MRTARVASLMSHASFLGHTQKEEKKKKKKEIMKLLQMRAIRTRFFSFFFFFGFGYAPVLFNDCRNETNKK